MNSHCQPPSPPIPLMCRLSCVNRRTIGRAEIDLHSIGNQTCCTRGKHVAKEVNGEPLARLVALVPSSDSVQPSRNEPSFTETTKKSVDYDTEYNA